MQFVRAFYAPNTPGGGPTGPSGEDISNAERLNEIFLEMKNTLRSISEEFSSTIRGNIEDLGDEAQRVAKSIQRDLNKEFQNSIKLTDQLRNNNSDLSKSLTSVAKIEQQIEAAKQRQLRIEDLTEELVREGVISQDEKNQLLFDATQQMIQQLNILNQQYRVAKQMENTIKGVGNGLKSLNKIPFVGPILSDLIKAEKVVEEMNKAAAKGASKMKVIGVGIGQLFENIGFGIIGGLLTSGLKFIIDSVLQFNKATYEAAKNLGTSVDEASKLQNRFVAIANSSANAGLMAKDLVKTYAELSDQLGFLAPSNKEFAETATLIQKRIGASAEQMGALATQSALSGRNLSQTYKIVQATRVIEGARNKIALTQRQILDGIAKVSDNVTINFKGSVAALTAAVVRATKLGTTLDQVNKQGESLLDFESSISKEFEAQVLTGRELNLTRARELALNNDTVGLMEELNKQGVTYETFMNQNAIARKAEAEAIGLSVEELSKKLLLQKQAEQLGAAEGQSLTDRYNQLVNQGKTQEQIAKMIGESEAADLRRASIAEKFEAALQRFKDILGSMLQGPVGGMLEAFAKFVGDTEKMTKLGNFLKKIFDGIQSTLERFPAILSSAITVLKVLASLSIARAVASIVGSLSTVPVVGAVAGLAAGAAAYGWLNSLMNGGGGSAPSVATPSAGTVSAPMTAPPSAAVASAKGQASMAAGPVGGQGAQSITLINQLDGEVLSKSVVKNTGKLYQKQTS